MIKINFPKQGTINHSHRLEELLILCWYDPQGISTVPENVAFIKSHSKFSITVLNLYEHRKNENSLSPRLNLLRFDGIIIHNTLSYNVENLRALDKYLETPLRKFQGVKVIMKQDENYKFLDLAKYIGKTGFDLIFTCLPPEAISLVYPEALVGKPKFSRMLTGYVTPTLRGIQALQKERTIDIGYRGSIQPLSFGRVAYEKRKIGEDIANLLHGGNVSLDISSRWEDRFGASSWFDFLLTCKATLGAESGASIFDLDGDLDRRCKIAETKYGPLSEDAEYAELFLKELVDIEDNINYRQISPRHFEAAATRTLQIMYPGEYSNIFIPGRHYFELARDYSNLHKAIEIINNEDACLRIVDCAYEEIILNPKYWIENFIKEFDDLLSEQFVSKSITIQPLFEIGNSKSNILLICAHKPTLDPRLSWISKGAPSKLEITQLGVLPPGSETSQLFSSKNGGVVLAEPIVKFDPCMLARWFQKVANNPAGLAGLSVISQISCALSMEEASFLELFAIPPDSERIDSFRWYLQYILDTTATLVEVVERIRGYDAIIATDLDTLPSALIIKGFSGVPIIYDSHEYWPESDPAALEFEVQFWTEMEKRLVKHVELCQTVSPGLAEIMSRQYGSKFDFIPNCEPLPLPIPGHKKITNPNGEVHFIFQGGFSSKRGLDLLIDAWPHTDQRAILILRGVNNPYKEMLIERARKLGLLGNRILFASPVREDELIEAAKEGDVGLIPYEPFGLNNTHCCPNKLSQYMAAGLPILANNTCFVNSIINDTKIGKVTDFSKGKNLVSAVSWFIENPEARSQMGAYSNLYFKNTFNWTMVSRVMYEKILDLIPEPQGGSLRVYPKNFNPKLYSDLVTPTFLKNKIIKISIQLWKKLPARIRIQFNPPLKWLLRWVY